MELIGNLKKQVESAKNRDEAKKMIENAGLKLTDDELNMVAGGSSIHVAEKEDTQHYNMYGDYLY
jgi:hypothetical protein